MSTSPSTTEILFALGVGEKVVGVTRFCDYPEEAKELPKIGGFTDLNLEAIVALTPDLVVGERNGGNRRVVEKLDALGIKTVFPPDTTLPEIFSAIREIGSAVGEPERGEELAASLKARLEEIRERTRGKARPKVLFVVGARPTIVAGKGSFADTLIEYAGGENVATEGLSEYPTYDMEAILRRAPEIIIDASMEGVDVKARWEKFPEIPAVSSGRVYAAPSSSLLRPGPRLAEGLQSLAELLHPDLSFPLPKTSQVD